MINQQPKSLRLFKRIFSIRTLLILVIMLVLGVGIAYNFQDPMVNYYSVRLRYSELDQYVQTHSAKRPPVLYCLQIAPISLGINDFFMCFDTQAEYDQISARRTEIQLALEE
jgi:hypothetical protein